MRLTQIRFFLAVVDSGSIRAAARNSGVSAPAITKSLRALEEELHVRLLERTQHGLVATAAGRAFVRRARAIQSELLKAEEECAEFAGGPAGAVAFGTGPTTMLLVPDALRQFRLQYPEAPVRIIEGLSPALLPMLREQTLDFMLGFRPDWKLESGLRFRPLLDDTLVITARKGHSLRNERSLERLADSQWLAMGPNWSIPALRRIFLEAGLTPPSSITQCDSFNVQVALLAGTDMLGSMSRRLLEASFARLVLQQVPIAQRMPSNTHGMFTRTAPLTPVAAAMAKALTAVARQMARRK